MVNIDRKQENFSYTISSCFFVFFSFGIGSVKIFNVNDNVILHDSFTKGMFQDWSQSVSQDPKPIQHFHNHKSNNQLTQHQFPHQACGTMHFLSVR